MENCFLILASVSHGKLQNFSNLLQNKYAGINFALGFADLLYNWNCEPHPYFPFYWYADKRESGRESFIFTQSNIVNAC